MRMISSIAVANYRSLLNLTTGLSTLNVVTGANGSGKSNLYKAFKLLSETARGGLVRALAEEGGLHSAAWAGPEHLARSMKAGVHAVQGVPRKDSLRLRLGFSTDVFSYSISLGMRTPMGNSEQYVPTKFDLDPAIKRECIWAGPHYRPAACLVDRNKSVVKMREGSGWDIYTSSLPSYDSILSEIADPIKAPEIFQMREAVRQWRFYDGFRTDKDSPIREPRIGTLTPVLDHEGHDVAAALQTIREIGDVEALHTAIDDAFPGSTLDIAVSDAGRFSIALSQDGMLRPLAGAELSDGTLRYLLLVAALLTPRPPSLLVLNEPETSLHPDLILALAGLIRRAATQTQVWVISHAQPLVDALRGDPACQVIALEKELGETVIRDQRELDKFYTWPDKD